MQNTLFIYTGQSVSLIWATVSVICQIKTASKGSKVVTQICDAHLIPFDLYSCNFNHFRLTFCFKCSFNFAYKACLVFIKLITAITEEGQSTPGTWFIFLLLFCSLKSKQNIWEVHLQWQVFHLRHLKETGEMQFSACT